MTREEIIAVVDKVKNGTITRVTYQTDMPVKAALKKQGYSITKIVETSGRLGVNYHNMAIVIARKAEEALQGKEPVVRANNYEWIIENKIKHNTSTDKDYLVLAYLPKCAHTKIKYIVTTPDGVATYSGQDFLKRTDLVDLIIKSYWTPSPTSGGVRTIAFENILGINKNGVKVTF